MAGSLSSVSTSADVRRRKLDGDGGNALRRQSEIKLNSSIFILPSVRLGRDARGRLQLLHVQGAEVLRRAHLAPHLLWIRVRVINARKICRVRFERAGQVKTHLLRLDWMVWQRVIGEQ